MHRFLQIAAMLILPLEYGNCMESFTDQMEQYCLNGTSTCNGSIFSVPLFILDNKTRRDITIQVGIIINEIPYYNTETPKNQTNSFLIPECLKANKIYSDNIIYKFITIRSFQKRTPIFINLSTLKNRIYCYNEDADFANTTPFCSLKLTNSIDLNNKISPLSSSKILETLTFKYAYKHEYNNSNEYEYKDSRLPQPEMQKNWKEKFRLDLFKTKKPKKIEFSQKNIKNPTNSEIEYYEFSYCLLGPNDFDRYKSELFNLTDAGFYTHNQMGKKYYNIILNMVGFSFEYPTMESDEQHLNLITYTFQNTKIYTIKQLQNSLYYMKIYSLYEKIKSMEKTKELFNLLKKPHSLFSVLPSDLIKKISFIYWTTLFYGDQNLNTAYFASIPYKRTSGYTTLEIPHEELCNSLRRNQQQNHTLRIIES